MTSWKTVACLLAIVFGVMSFLNETEAGRLKQTQFKYTPPRLRDYINIKNRIYKKPGDKKNRLHSEIMAAGNKVVVRVPNPPIVFDKVLEYWPYHRVYVTSVLGLINYVHKIIWVVYKIVWIFIEMIILIFKIVFQATEIGKLKHSYDELNRPHPFAFNLADYD